METTLIIILAIWNVLLQAKLSKISNQVDRLVNNQPRDELTDLPEEAETAVDQTAMQTTEQIVERNENSFVVSPLETKEEPVVDQTTNTTQNDQSVEDLLIKKILPTIGVLSVVLGVGFLVTWSYSNGWLGPKGLVGLGTVFSASIVVAGELLRGQFPKYFAYLTATGLLGLSTCVYVAERIYGFIDSGFAFACYIAIMATGFGLAGRYGSRLLSVLVAIGSFFVPFLLGDTSSSPYVMMTYSGILLLTGSWIMYTKGWYETAVVLAGSLFVYAGMILDHVSISGITGTVSPVVYLIWAYGAAAVFSATVTARALQEQSTSEDLTAGSAINIIALLSVVGVVNIYGFICFETLGWSYFGFFVLAQAVVLYGASEFARTRELVVYQQLYIAGTLAAVLFATVWEIGLKENALFAVLLLSAQAGLFAAVGYKAQAALRNIFWMAALGAEVCAFAALAHLTGDFVPMTLGVGALITVALYQIYLYTQEYVVSGGWVIALVLQALFAAGLFVNWNYGVLYAELGTTAAYVWPFVIGALVAYIAMYYWTRTQATQFIWVSILAALCNALFFMAYASLGPVYSVMVVGFAVCMLGLAAPTVMIKLSKTNELGIVTNQWDLGVKFTVISTALGWLWFAFWWFDDPASTVLLMLVGIGYVLIGLRTQYNTTRATGLSLVGLVVAKLYLIDIWSWSVFWKFVALLPVGLLLISLPFWYQKLKK